MKPNEHSHLFALAFIFFVTLTLAVAIVPALVNQYSNHELPGTKPMTLDEVEGKKVFISYGCVACHTQQVRDIPMDRKYGGRPSIAADYAGVRRTDLWRNTATLMGTERTGPDLTNIGSRQPSEAWHLLHLFQPRAVVPGSVMPAYTSLFDLKDSVMDSETVLSVPAEFAPKDAHVVPRKQAKQLVAYLLNLKQVSIPDGSPLTGRAFGKEELAATGSSVNRSLSGADLYTQYCQSCHQEKGEGLKGAFPPLKGSTVVTGNDIGLYVDIIMRGYDARPEFATMPAVGMINALSAEDIAAIINHERTSWGNNAKPVSVEEVRRVVETIKTDTKK